MADNLPPGATLVSGTVPSPSDLKLPPGATLVSGTPPAQTRQPTWLDKVKNFISKLGPPEESQESKEFFLGLAGTGAGMTSGTQTLALAKEALPSAERAGQSFKELEGTIGTHPVAVTDDLSRSLNELRQASTTTNTGIPSVVRKLMDRLDPLGGMPQLTYKEARAFSSEIGDLAASEKMGMSDNTKRLVGNLYGALKDTTQDTADLAGHGVKLQNAIDEYRQAMKIKGVTGAAKDFAINEAWKWVLGGLTGGTVAYGAKKAIEQGLP